MNNDPISCFFSLEVNKENQWTESSNSGSFTLDDLNVYDLLPGKLSKNINDEESYSLTVIFGKDGNAGMLLVFSLKDKILANGIIFKKNTYDFICKSRNLLSLFKVDNFKKIELDKMESNSFSIVNSFSKKIVNILVLFNKPFFLMVEKDKDNSLSYYLNVLRNVFDGDKLNNYKILIENDKESDHVFIYFMDYNRVLSEGGLSFYQKYLIKNISKTEKVMCFSKKNHM